MTNSITQAVSRSIVYGFNCIHATRQTQIILIQIRLRLHPLNTMSEDLNEQEEMIINQQYKIWKKAVPHIYDFCLLRSLDWPTMTFQWLPDCDSDDLSENHYAWISSNSSEPNKSELKKIRVRFPKNSRLQQYVEEDTNKIEVIDSKVLGSEINRARYCYANPEIVASTHANGDILITYKEEVYLKLSVHTGQGYGLSWSPKLPSYLASGQSDKKICIWDIEKSKSETNKTTPVQQIMYHSTPVEDVAWHKSHSNVLASCSDDRMIMLWDLRFRASVGEGAKKPLFEIIAHTNQIYSLDFSPFHEFLFLSGSADETASIWDMRNLTRSLETVKCKGSIIKAQWSPYSINLFATCGHDRRVSIWDLSLRNGSGEKDEEKQEFLFFTHEGHRSRVVDLNWNPHKKFVIGSVEENNCLHVWEARKELYYQTEG